MPNICSTSIEVDGPQAEDWIAALTRYDQEKKCSVVDFNRVVPEPEWPPRPTLEEVAASGNLELMQQYKDLAERIIAWREEHWGTKWNADESSVEGSSLSFDTAWAPPMPVINAVTDAYPDVRLIVRTSDDVMNFFITYRYADGDWETDDQSQEINERAHPPEMEGRIKFINVFVNDQGRWDVEVEAAEGSAGDFAPPDSETGPNGEFLF